MPTSARRTLRGLALAAALVLTMTAAACGGSSGANVAQIGTNGARQPHAPQTFSACMRSHGVANFPDADTDGRIHAAGIDKRSPAFQGAYSACRSLEPGGQLTAQARTQLQRQLLAFAKCMRAHGVPSFPDPAITADGQHFGLGTHPLDTNSPAFGTAATYCRGKLSGSDAESFFGKLVGKR
jgi:hypothetical protein